MAKRDLAKLGITNLEQLEMPLPPGILIKGKLVLRKDDDGNESNQLKHFEFIGVEKGDAYEPEDLENTGGNQGDGRPLEPNSKPSPELAGNGNGQKTGEMFPFGDKGNGQDDRGKAFLAHERGGLTK
jgi:hypothetical protein